MKMTRMLTSLSILLVLNISVIPILAKAPTTPKILFTSLRDGNREVYMMNPDGTEQVNLTQHRADDLRAVWSPTGEQILFVSDRGGTRVRDLYLMDADGANVRRVFKKKIEAWRTNPTWSPDGKQIAYEYVDWTHLEFGLYIATLGEEDAEHIGNGGEPAWSPDGSEIACYIGDPRESQLTFINIHTREREQPLPTKALLWQFDPSWSAVGDRLAFLGIEHPLPVILDRDLHNAWKDKQGIYIVNRDGTGLQQLVDEAGPPAQYPALSPNGEEVLYTQRINGRFQIFKIDVNSRTRTQMTHIVGLSLLQANSGGDWFDPAYALPVSPQPQLLSTLWGKVKKK